jgi:hypothetical protein
MGSDVKDSENRSITLVFVRSAHSSVRGGIQPEAFFRSWRAACTVASVVAGAEDASAVELFRPTGLVLEDGSPADDTARRVSACLKRRLGGEAAVKPQHFLMQNVEECFIVKSLPHETDFKTRYAIMVAPSKVIEDNLALLLGEAQGGTVSKGRERAAKLTENLKPGGVLVVEVDLPIDQRRGKYIRPYDPKLQQELLSEFNLEWSKWPKPEQNDYMNLAEIIKNKGRFEECGVFMELNFF